MNFHHVSVLRKETIDNLITDPDGIYVDCTLGGGGHSRALAERLSPKATLIGLDQDRDAIAAATERLKDTACRRILVQRNFRYLPDVLDELGIEKVDGVMFDLGVSSYQLDTPERGFSYMQDGPLDMRMDRSEGLTAADIVIHYDPWWNVAAQNQATDRAYRIGQEKPVTVYKLILKDTIEENLLKLQNAKLALAAQVVSEGMVSLGDLSQNELMELFEQNP